VEDFPAYRRFICSTLVESFDLRVIAEVTIFTAKALWILV